MSHISKDEIFSSPSLLSIRQATFLRSERVGNLDDLDC
jgi:hypothetical protein